MIEPFTLLSLNTPYLNKKLTSTPLQTFPQEIWCKIFASLDYPSYRAIRRVSRRAKEIVEAVSLENNAKRVSLLASTMMPRTVRAYYSPLRFFRYINTILNCSLFTTPFKLVTLATVAPYTLVILIDKLRCKITGKRPAKAFTEAKVFPEPEVKVEEQQNETMLSLRFALSPKKNVLLPCPKPLPPALVQILTHADSLKAFSESFFDEDTR